MKEFITSDIFGTAAEWSSVCTIKITIPDEVIESIQKVKDLLKLNDFISHATIGSGASEVIQYDGYVGDDEPMNELKREDLDYFRTDVEEIKVYSHASYYVMHNKYTSDFLEVQIPE